MKVKELIEHLRSFPEDVDVFVGILGNNVGEISDIEGVSENGGVQITVKSTIFEDHEDQISKGFVNPL